VKPVAFDYCRADTVDDVLGLLAEYGPDASIVAGGMSLGPMLNMRVVRPVVLVDVNVIPGLAGIAEHDGTVVTGATVRQADALRDPIIAAKVPLLARALPNVGHYQTRSRGTLGGSAAHADPSAEIPLSLVTLGGHVVLRSARGERRVPAAAFFVGALTTAREPDEMVVGLVWPARTAATGYAFEEIAQRHGDFAITAAAAAATVGADGTLKSASLGLGGVEDRPIRIDAAAFAGWPASAGTAQAIADDAAAKVDPMEDLQANAPYRRQLVRVLGARVLAEAFEDARR